MATAQGQQQTLDPGLWSSAPVLFPGGVERTTPASHIFFLASGRGRCRCRTAPEVPRGESSCRAGVTLASPAGPVLPAEKRGAAPMMISLCRPLAEPAGMCACAHVYFPRRREPGKGDRCFRRAFLSGTLGGDKRKLWMSNT